MWSEPFVSRWRTMTWFLGPNGKIHLPQAVLTTMDQGQHWKIATSVSHTSRAGRITREEGRGGEKWRAEVCVLLCFLWSNLISSFAVRGVGRNVETVLTSLKLHVAAARFHLCEWQIGWVVFIHFAHMPTKTSRFITLHVNIILFEVTENHKLFMYNKSQLPLNVPWTEEQKNNL